MNEGCKQCLQKICEWENIYSNNSTINTTNTDITESIKSRNTNNIINTIYTRFVLTCGSGKKYKQCCGK